MALKRRQFTRKFKLQVLREIDAGKGISQAAREYQVHPNMIHRWRAHYCDYGERAFAGNGIASVTSLKKCIIRSDCIRPSATGRQLNTDNYSTKPP